MCNCPDFRQIAQRMNIAVEEAANIGEDFQIKVMPCEQWKRAMFKNQKEGQVTEDG